MIDAADLTLDELRIALAPAIADSAIFDGWTQAALLSAAEMEGVNPALARLAYKSSGRQTGTMAMVAAWIESIDMAMQRDLSAEALAGRKIRDKIRDLVLYRLDAVAGQEEAMRRALAIGSMPQNLRASMRGAWNSADIMWRLAGDTATDYNHYTKRAILASLYSATLLVWIDDESEDKAETRAFLDRRIDNVMQFEKTKAQFLGGSDRESFSPVRMLGRLRYPAA
ncbi:MAG: COQ9 family protein [Erythrobacter sp.]|nr:COQ9 family protein [Erythrobacter sp.]NCQ64710.1 COQ9 family protein [Alphaproteobacteria bacterium]